MRPVNPHALQRLEERERRQLESLVAELGRTRVDAASVSEALPEAVALRTGRDSQLPKSLVEATEKAIEYSVKRNPAALSDALFPIIGSAIRKALQKLLADSMQRMNTGLESAFSFRRLAWRLEARRTATPYAQILLRHTVECRVEQVFLIHRGKGILLATAAQDGSRVADDELVSSMLTAIRDFVKDSLRVTTDDGVNSLSVGEYTVVAEEGPQAIVAGVVRGVPVPQIRELLLDALDSVHLHYAGPLKAFQGDTAPFAEAPKLLERCLYSSEKSKGSKAPVYSLIVLAVLAAGLGLLAGRALVRHGRVSALARELGARPGIVVTEVDRRPRPVTIRGLRDPLAGDPGELLGRHQLEPQEVRFELEPYQALTPELILLRAQRSLAPPRGVKLFFREGTLWVSGYVPPDWETKVRIAATSLGGVERLRFLTPGQMPGELREMADAVEAVTIFFESDATTLLPGQEESLRRVAGLAGRFAALGESFGARPLVEVVGHIAGSPADPDPADISGRRAVRIRDLLRQEGVAESLLRARGAGSREPVRPERAEEDRRWNRSVTFRLLVDGVPVTP